MKQLPLTVCALIFLLAAPVIAAVDCPALVQQALAATDSMCQTTATNEACYGNIHLQAKPSTNIAHFTFNQPGDRVNLNDIKSLQLSPMTLDTNEWGVALMHLQANLPAKNDRNVMVLAFGDVRIENDAPLPTAADVAVIGKDAVNVRWMPNIKAGAVAVLQPGQEVTAVERLADSSWLRINLPDSGETGWIKSDLVKGQGDLSTLNVVKGDQPNYRPMQAFTFSSGSDEQNCAEIPKNGLLIQTPEGAGEIRLWINQVLVKMGSTVYFQAKPNGDMLITTLEGHATVEALGVTHTAVAGTTVTVKMGADLKPTAPPSLPDSYPVADVQNLPIGHLQREITVHAPLTAEAVKVVQQQQQAIMSLGTTAVGVVTDTVGCVLDSCSNSTNGVVGTVGAVASTVVNTDTGGNTDNENDDGNSDTGLVGTILQLPCVLLLCK